MWRGRHGLCDIPRRERRGRMFGTSGVERSPLKQRLLLPAIDLFVSLLLGLLIRNPLPEYDL